MKDDNNYFTFNVYLIWTLSCDRMKYIEIQKNKFLLMLSVLKYVQCFDGKIPI